MARRLVEAGVSVVTLKVGDWDTHEKNFLDMREQLPQLDQGFHALVTDLHDRGLEKDVAVVMWGEFGRAPQISRGDGRDHWPEAGAAVVAGGGFKVGQVIGETDAHGGRSKGTPVHARATCWRACTATWASTRRRRSPTTTAADARAGRSGRGAGTVGGSGVPCPRPRGHDERPCPRRRGHGTLLNRLLLVPCRFGQAADD